MVEKLIFITILIGVYSCGSQQKQDGVGKLNTGQVENSLEVKDTILDVEELDKEVRNNCNCKNGMLEEYPVAIDSDDMFLIDSLVDGNKVIQAYFFQLKDSVLPKKITNQISQRTGWHCLPDLESPFGNEIIRTDSSLSILLKDTIQYHFNLSDGELHHTIEYVGYCESIDAYKLRNVYWDGRDVFYVDRKSGSKFSLGSAPAINVESKLIVETFADEYIGSNNINVWDLKSYKDGPIKTLFLVNLSAGMFTTPPTWISSNQYVVKFYRFEKGSRQSIRTYGIIELK